MNTAFALHNKKEIKTEYLKSVLRQVRYDVYAVLPLFCYTRINFMTAYHFTSTRKTMLPSTNVQEKKAARKKLLDAVFQRRAGIYKRFMENQRLQASGKIDMIV